MTSLEEITSADGRIIAIVIKNAFKKDGMNFVSKPHFPLQLGFNSYRKGEKVKAHVHVEREIVIKEIQEILYIKTGEVQVDLYDGDKTPFRSFRLFPGDWVFFVTGGHGIKMIKDTTIIEVKQGPYNGKGQDKVVIE